jgi:hypothetical protein
MELFTVRIVCELPSKAHTATSQSTARKDDRMGEQAARLANWFLVGVRLPGIYIPLLSSFKCGRDMTLLVTTIAGVLQEFCDN